MGGKLHLATFVHLSEKLWGVGRKTMWGLYGNKISKKC